MRILVVNQYFTPDSAASAQRLADIAEDLARHHDVTVIAGRPGRARRLGRGPRTRAANDAGSLEVLRVPATALRRQRMAFRLLNYLTYLPLAALRGVLVKRTDLVLAGTDPPLVALVGWALSRLHRSPLVYVVWDLHPDAAVALGMLRRPGVAALLARLHRFVARRATRLVVPCGAMRRRIVAQGVPRDRVAVIPHWEDTDVIFPEPKENPYSRAHGLDRRFVVMYSGNLGMAQQLELCVDLADRLRDLPEALVVLIGDGVAKPRLEGRARELALPNIRFLPYEPRDRMRYSLAAADVLLVPLAAGLTGCMVASKVFTVMASGRPFVAPVEASSDVAALSARFDCGIRVAPGDLAALERAVRWLHANPEAARTMGARGPLACEAVGARTRATARYRRLLERAAPTRGWPRPALETGAEG